MLKLILKCVLAALMLVAAKLLLSKGLIPADTIAEFVWFVALFNVGGGLFFGRWKTKGIAWRDLYAAAAATVASFLLHRWW